MFARWLFIFVFGSVFNKEIIVIELLQKITCIVKDEGKLHFVKLRDVAVDEAFTWFIYLWRSFTYSQVQVML